MITQIIYKCNVCGGSFAIAPCQDESKVIYCVICGAKLGEVFTNATKEGIKFIDYYSGKVGRTDG
jgi:predicted nucleic acid-binding Zn ribbon protein